MRIAFVYSNPGHHAEMMAPVMRELAARGAELVAVSLAELRGMTTRPLEVAAVEVVRAIPAQLRKNPSVGGSFGVDGEGAAGLARRTAQTAVWAALAPRLLYLLRGADVVVIPNDVAYPYRDLCKLLRWRHVPFVLLQEGIRFPLPGVVGKDAYGAGGAAAICAWGEASAAYFRAQGASPATIHVTGSPRFDALDLARWRAEGAALRTRLGLREAPLLFLSNPIDDQGFCATADKLALFGRFLDAAAPTLAARGVPVLVKLHPREDVAGFRAAAAASAAADRTTVVDDAPLYAVLGAGRAAVVLASTVGLEALLFDLPLGVLELPGHGHVFDYVSRGGAVPLTADPSLPAALTRLLAPTGAAASAAYLGSQIDGRGTASARAAAVIARAER